jgi:aryl-alcohol dehydrogenase
MLGPLGCGLQTGAGAVLNVMQPAAGQSIAVYGVCGVGLAGRRWAGLQHSVRLDFGALDRLASGVAIAGVVRISPGSATLPNRGRSAMSSPWCICSAAYHSGLLHC